MLVKFIGVLISAALIISLVKMINSKVVWMFKAMVSAKNNESLCFALKEYKTKAIGAYTVLWFLSKFVMSKNKKFLSFFVLGVYFVELIIIVLAIISFCNVINLVLDIVLYVQGALGLLFLLLEPVVESRECSELIDDITIKTMFSENRKN